MTMESIDQTQPDCNKNAFERAETFNYQPTTKERQARLIGMFLTGAGRYPGVPLEPKSQEEIVMYRLGRGNGAPVELPRLQQDEHGKGFISQFTARIHALKNRHGFRIRNRVDYTTNPIKSWYWLEVNENGFPVLDSVSMAERKTGTPIAARTAKSEPSLRQSPLAPNGGNESRMSAEPAQANMFSSFMSYETGARHGKRRA